MKRYSILLICYVACSLPLSKAGLVDVHPSSHSFVHTFLESRVSSDSSIEIDTSLDYARSELFLSADGGLFEHRDLVVSKGAVPGERYSVLNASQFWFTLDETVNFAVGGFFEGSIDAVLGETTAFMTLELSSWTTDTFERIENFAVESESAWPGAGIRELQFQVDGIRSDDADLFVSEGLLSGVLDPGFYLLDTNIEIQGYGEGYGEGAFRMELTAPIEAKPVPEPSSFGLLGALSLLGLLVRRYYACRSSVAEEG